jgi:chromate transport protein ChrA
MGISELFIKVLLVMVPGILAALFVASFAFERKWNQFRFILYSAILSVVAYATLGLFQAQVARKSWEALLGNATDIRASEVLFATLIAVGIALLLSYIIVNKGFFRLFKLLGLTSKYGEESLYSHFLATQTLGSIYIHSLAHNLTYSGWVTHFAEKPAGNEILLEDVDVYEYKTAKFLYKLEKAYICFDSNNFVIEVPEIAEVHDA